MKNKKLLFLTLIIISVFGLNTNFSQVTINMDCDDSVFVDNGGANNNYSNNLNNTYIICPNNTSDYVNVDFISFETEVSGTGCWDYMEVYNGNSITSPAILTSGGQAKWCYDSTSTSTGTGSLAGIDLYSTDPNGCMTFRFVSDGSVVKKGWIANVSCEPKPVCMDYPTNINVVYINNDSVVITWDANSNVQNWVLEYGVVDIVTQGSGTILMLDTNFAFIGGLQSNTEYKFWLSSLCTPTDTSFVVGSIKFETTKDFCNGELFTDNGDTNLNYLNSTDETYIICPDNVGDYVSISFTQFVTEVNFNGICNDIFTIYNGIGENAINIVNTQSGASQWCWENGNGTEDLTGKTIYSTDSTGCMTFGFVSNTFTTRNGWIANVTCNPQPTCNYAPSGIQVTYVGIDSVYITWDDNTNIVSWNFEYGNLNTTSGNGIVINTSDNFIGLPSLNSNTKYKYWITAMCDTNSDSTFTIGAKYFNTKKDYCAGDLFTDSGDTLNNYSGSENNTYVICPNDTGDYVNITFTQFDVNANANGSCEDYMLVFNGNNTNTSNYVLTNGGDSTWCWETTIGKGNLVNKQLYSTDSTGCMTFKFKSDLFGQNKGWIAGVTCIQKPTCAAAPQNIEITYVGYDTAIIKWKNDTNVNSWNVEYGISPVLLGNGTTVNTNDTSLILSGLQSNSNYSFWVTALCNPNNDSSFIIGPFTFTTDINFCSGDPFTDDGGINNDYANNANETYVICANNASDYVNIQFTQFELESISSTSCWDWLKVFNGNSIASTPILTPQGLDKWCHENDGTGTGDLTMQSLISTDPSGCLTFQLQSDGIITMSGWIAEITCNPQPTCPETPTNIVVDYISKDSVHISWGINFNVDHWSVEYGISPISNGNGTSINTSINSIGIGNLTANTNYTFWITAVCANTLDSTFSIGKNFFKTTKDYCANDQFTDDNLGTNGNYSNNANQTYTICPDNNGDGIIMDFTQFEVSTNFNSNICQDSLVIYDNSTANGNVIVTNSGARNWCWNNGLGSGDLTQMFISSSPENPSGCLTFRFYSNAFTNDLGWTADVTCGPIDCSVASGFQSTAVVMTSITLDWVNAWGTSDYQILYVNYGGSIANATSVTATTSPFTINNLPEGEVFDFYLISACDNGDMIDTLGPVTAKTQCNAKSTPYFYDVESQNVVEDGYYFNDCYSTTNINQNLDNATDPKYYFWASTDSTTPSLSTGADFAKSGKKFFYIEATGEENDNTGESSASLYTPWLNLSGLANPGSSFWYHMYGHDTNMKLQILVKTSTGITTEIASLIGPQHTKGNSPWKMQVLNLSDYSNQTIQLVLKGIRGNNMLADFGDISIDNIFVGELNKVAIDDITDIENFVVFPNPNSGVFKLKNLGESKETIISITDIIGRVIYNQTINFESEENIEIDLSSKSNGTYLLNVNTDNQIETYKIVLRK